MSIEALLSKLDKKTAARVLLAKDAKMVRHPYRSLGLTAATGGWVEGRFHMFYGPKSSGKSTQIYQTIADRQDADPNFTAAIIDAEQTFDPDYARSLGMDPDRVILSYDKSFEQAQNSAVALIEAGVDLLLVDSISTLIPMAFFEKDGSISGADGMKQIGVRAKSCGIMLNAMHYVNDHTAVFLISQAKMQLGSTQVSMGYDGGKATEHGCTQIIRLTASAALGQQIELEDTVNGKPIKVPAGREVKWYVEKNKSGNTSAAGEYKMWYNDALAPRMGIDTVDETITLALAHGLITKGGAWYTVNGKSLQGDIKVAEYLMSDLDYFEDLQSKVLAAIG